MLILWAWTALLSGFVLWPTYSGRGDTMVPIGIAGVCLVLFTVLHPRFRPARAENGNQETPRRPRRVVSVGD